MLALYGINALTKIFVPLIVLFFMLEVNVNYGFLYALVLGTQFLTEILISKELMKDFKRSQEDEQK
jgi:hypothetical protein